MARKRDDWLEMDDLQIMRYGGELSHLYALCVDLPFSVMKTSCLIGGESLFWHEFDGQIFSVWGFLSESDFAIRTGRVLVGSPCSKKMIRSRIESGELVGFDPHEVGRVYQHVMKSLGGGPLPF